MNTLFVGLGSIGRRHLQSCHRIRPQGQYAAWRQRSSSRANAFPDLWELARVEEIAAFSPDLIWICTPTAQHWAAFSALAEALRPKTPTYFFEKPLTHRIDHLNLIGAELKRSRAPFFYGCILRYHPLVRRVREILEQSKIGRPLSYSLRCGSDLRTWRPGQDYRQSYSAHQDQGGGVHLDLIHEFDMATYWFGPIEDLGGGTAKVSTLEIDSMDYCSASAKHSNGVNGRILLDYFTETPVRMAEVLGERGGIRANLLTGELHVNEDVEHHSIDRDGLHDLQTMAIFECLETGRPSPWKLDEVLKLNKQVITLGDRRLQP